MDNTMKNTITRQTLKKLHLFLTFYRNQIHFGKIEGFIFKHASALCRSIAH